MSGNPPRVHLIHGFNVSDGGRASIRKLEPYIKGSEISHDYGWTELLMLKATNDAAVEQILAKFQPGDFLIGHSNGGLVEYRLAEILGDQLGGIICINPALRRDVIWPGNFPVLCLYNSQDWVVQLGRAWATLVTCSGIRPHGWGAAGRYGFTHDRRVQHVDTAETVWGDMAVRGWMTHSQIFHDELVAFWGRFIDEWIDAYR